MTRPAAQTSVDLPNELRQPVQLWFDRLREQGDGDECSDDLKARIARVVACSEFAGSVLLREWSWFVDRAATFHEDEVEQEEQDSVEEFVACASTLDEVKSVLRRYRNRTLLRILWRELHGLADLDDTLRELSALADHTMSVATRVAAQQMTPRYGCMRSADGAPIPLVILGMGKLGGRELNFSSDIDIIFCYSDHGKSDGGRELSAEEYFARLTRHIIALIDEVTVDGFVFRIDTRLRPFGESGPPVISFAALETYLQSHGRDWERYAYIKARVVGLQPPSEVLKDLNDNLIRPFVYRRYLDYGVFSSLREMHSLIAAEVRRRELADNIKLGPGGIREAEFIVQALQLVRGGGEPELQDRELQAVLPKLVSERGLTETAAQELRLAYRFLRRLENFIQAIRDQQTHNLPKDEIDRARLTVAMRCANWDQLMVELNRHRAVISEQFVAIAFRERGDADSQEQPLRELWEANADERRWGEALQNVSQGISNENAALIAESVVRFASATPTKQIDAISSERLQQFIPALLLLVLEARSPLSALTRTLTVVEKVLRRSAYLALLNENHLALSRLVSLCESSQYITERLSRYPALLDELLDPRAYSEQVTKKDLDHELRQRIDTVVDSEERIHSIAKFQRAMMFRIAVADFNDQLPIMKVSDALTWLAEVVLENSLHVAWRELTRQHGVPQFEVGGVVREAGFGIVGYGKLGGLELSYGSDLDVVFLHNSTGSQQVTNGSKPLDNKLFFARLVRRLVHYLTTQMSSGALYEIDTRLRPDGRSGLLVTSIDAFERYQDENAWTWEHQALLRARAVAGDLAVAGEFARIREETLVSRVGRSKLRDDVISMRQKMRKELDRSDASKFDLKHGRGGIGDIEFLVQYLVLREACDHSEVIVYSDNIRQLDALIEVGCLEASIGAGLQDAYRNYRLYLHRLVLDGQPATVPADLFEKERTFVSTAWDERLGSH